MLIKVGTHWINPAHVTNVSPNNFYGEEGQHKHWTSVDLVTGTSIQFGLDDAGEQDDEDHLTPSEIATLLNEQEAEDARSLEEDRDHAVLALCRIADLADQYREAEYGSII